MTKFLQEYKLCACALSNTFILPNCCIWLHLMGLWNTLCFKSTRGRTNYIIAFFLSYSFHNSAGIVDAVHVQQKLSAISLSLKLYASKLHNTIILFLPRPFHITMAKGEANESLPQHGNITEYSWVSYSLLPRAVSSQLIQQSHHQGKQMPSSFTLGKDGLLKHPSTKTFPINSERVATHPVETMLSSTAAGHLCQTLCDLLEQELETDLD